jgi:MFS family permease
MDVIKTGWKEPRFYGWRALIGVMLAYGGLCGDIIYAYGIFLPAMGESFHWSRLDLSGPYALFIIVGGMLGPVAGMTVSRFGARKNIISCNIVAVLGLLGMSRVGELWHVYLFFGVMAGMSLGFGEFVSVTTVINNWFIRRRPLAMGLLFVSGGIGGFAFSPLISWLISGLGWRTAWVCIAAIHLLLTVILGGMLIRSQPEDVGQVPDGLSDVTNQTLAEKTARYRVYQTSVDWNLRDALHAPALWMIVASFSAFFFALNMLTTHQVVYLQDLNFSPMMSATVFGLMIGISIIGRLLSGTLALRFESRHLAAVFLTSMGLGIVALIYARDICFIYLYSILTGIGFGGMIVLMPNLLGAYFGRTHYSRIAGWTTPVITLACAASPVVAGFLYDVTGKYFFSFCLAAVLIFASVIITLLSRPPRLPAMIGVRVQAKTGRRPGVDY